MAKPRNVDEYIASAPEEVQLKLRQLRQIIRSAAPEAEEKISYSIPYYSLNGRLAYFAYFKDHVSLFAMSSATQKFAEQVKPYHRSKSTIGFSNNEPLPIALIKKVVDFRVAEQRGKK